MNRLALWLDNPILVKHARSRLRRMQAIPSVAVVMVIALTILVFGYQWNRLSGGEAFGGLLTLQLVILGFMGASQVSSSVGKARESGILDFHRASPMPPFAEALGFFFGAPIREYLMFAATLPFALVCVFAGRPDFLAFVQIEASLVLVAWTLQSIGLMSALAGKERKTGSRGVVGLVLFLLFGGSWLVPFFGRVSSLVGQYPTGHFFEVPLPWLLILAIDLLPIVGFFLVAATRKLASERAHPLSKPQAIGALATGATLILGGIWKIDAEFYWTLLVLYLLIVGSIILIVAVTPNLDEFSKGIRKAAKEGQKYPSAWSDRGLNRIALFCLCGVVLVAPTVVWKAIERPVSWGGQVETISYSLPIAIGVLVVAYFGLSLQFFQLRFGKRGTVFFSLFLFVAWLLPLALGAISAAAFAQRRTPDSGPDAWSLTITSLSPIFGIAVSSGVGSMPGLDQAKGAALLPALIFALLFNNLVTSTRRRVEKSIHPDPGPAPDLAPEPIPEPSMAT